MFPGEPSGAEAKNNENKYCHYVYLDSSSHLNSTGKQNVEKIPVFTN